MWGVVRGIRGGIELYVGSWPTTKEDKDQKKGTRPRDQPDVTRNVIVTSVDWRFGGKKNDPRREIL